MLFQLSTSVYDPETDGPPAGAPLTNYSYTNLLLASLLVPVCICLPLHLISWLFRPGGSSKQQTAQRAPASLPPAKRQQHSKHNTRGTKVQSRSTAPEWRQEQQHLRRVTPADAYCQHLHLNRSMEPPQHQQQYASPATDRPFRHTQSQRRTPSPQSDRPFRVTQSHRVYDHTPDALSPASHMAAQPLNQSPAGQTPQTDRPFRVSQSARAQHRTPHSNGNINPGQPGHMSGGPVGPDMLFRFHDPDITEQQTQHHSAGAPVYAANGPVANGVPLLFATNGQPQPQHQHSTYPHISQQGSPPYGQASYQHQQQQQQEYNWNQRGAVEHQHQQRRQQRRRTPIWGLPARHNASQELDPCDDDFDDDDALHVESQHDWDDSLLRRCAQTARYITSTDALQQSPEYRHYITQARKRQLTFEQKEKHRLNVYKALRNVDPDAFRQLFSRSDVLEYDQVPLSRAVAAVELLLSAAITFALLGLPLWSPAWQPFQAVLAAVWIGQLLFTLSCGTTSLPAWALSIYPTQGAFSMPPGWGHLLAAVAVDTLLVVGLPVVGVLLGLSYRLLTLQRQSCGGWLLHLEPVREEVRPMHFSPYSPGGDAGGITSDEE